MNGWVGESVGKTACCVTSRGSMWNLDLLEFQVFSKTNVIIKFSYRQQNWRRRRWEQTEPMYLQLHKYRQKHTQARHVRQRISDQLSTEFLLFCCSWKKCETRQKCKHELCLQSIPIYYIVYYIYCPQVNKKSM